MLRRIAIHQWEVMRHSLLYSIKDLNLQDSDLEDAICRRILYPLYEKDRNLQYSVKEGQYADPIFFINIAKEQMKSSEYNAKIIYNIGRYAYFLNHNKAVLELIKYNIFEISHNIKNDLNNLIDYVGDIPVPISIPIPKTSSNKYKRFIDIFFEVASYLHGLSTSEPTPKPKEHVIHIREALFDPNIGNMNLDNIYVRENIYAIRGLVRIKLLKAIFKKEKDKEVINYMMQYNTILLSMNKLFKFDFTQLEFNDNDSQELKNELDKLEENNHFFGIIGWKNYDTFNVKYKKFIDFDISDEKYHKLDIETFRKNGQVNTISEEDIKDVRDYLDLRAIPHHKTEFEFPGILEMNCMLRRIAIDLWEGMKYRLLSFVRHINLDAFDGIRNALRDEILYPLYEEDKGIQYSVEKTNMCILDFLIITLK